MHVLPHQLIGNHYRDDLPKLLEDVRRGADKYLAFPIFLFAAQPKEFFLDGLTKLEQRSHECVELKGEYVE
jgi:hypothetical protein